MNQSQSDEDLTDDEMDAPFYEASAATSHKGWFRLNWWKADSRDAREESFGEIWRKKALVALFYIIGWYVTSLSLSVYNKWLFSKDHQDFPYPLFTTMIHNIILFLLSLASVNFIVPQMKPSRYPSLYDYTTKVFPCGLATGLDIGLSNCSLKYITLTFYTMVKSGAPVFVLLFAFLFKLEKPSTSLVGVICIICIGVLLMVMDKTNFHVLGYMFVQIATVLSGLRWALTQVLLSKESIGMTNPLATNMFLAPLMAITLLSASLLTENLYEMSQSPLFQSSGSVTSIVLIISLGGFIAFIMLTFEFQLIQATSVVTFSIAGIVKEILTIVISAMVFGDKFTGTAPWGLLISLIGISFYNYLRLDAMYKSHLAHKQQEEQAMMEEELEEQDGSIELLKQ